MHSNESAEKEDGTVATSDKDYPNSGILFKNDRKRDDKDPGYAGNGDLTCPRCNSRFQVFVNAWVKTGRTGAKFFSLSFKPKGARPAAVASDNGDIPF
jgi:hypothetical protein